MAPDWAARVADTRLHLDPRLPKALEVEGLKLLRMRELMQAWRELQAGSAPGERFKAWPRPEH
ncbi:hypothetical protein [Paucibacter sp. B51]|uniref:hypothetical protein n=1 Tax=Paucibacter sp. B51 TaxID=2993315 RepID=UPI0022EC13CF|nr:hypothetical protein [Paucibacter sp. B51]